jgi:anti-sigma B factor antagonist
VTATSIDPPTGELATITVSGAAPVFRVIAAGEIDASTAPALRDQLTALLDDLAEDITVDLEAVTFLDSAGLCVLAAAHRRAGEQGGHLRVVASGRAVVRPLQITGLWDLLTAQDGSAPARV